MERYPIEKTPGGLRYVDVKVKSGDTFRFMVQNPNKDSIGASLAKIGHKITWIFKNHYYSGDGVIDGEYTEHLNDRLREIQQSDA